MQPRAPKKLMAYFRTSEAHFTVTRSHEHNATSETDGLEVDGISCGNDGTDTIVVVTHEDGHLLSKLADRVVFYGSKTLPLVAIAPAAGTSKPIKSLHSNPKTTETAPRQAIINADFVTICLASLCLILDRHSARNPNLRKWLREFQQKFFQFNEIKDGLSQSGQ